MQEASRHRLKTSACSGDKGGEISMGWSRDSFGRAGNRFGRIAKAGRRRAAVWAGFDFSDRPPAPALAGAGGLADALAEGVPRVQRIGGLPCGSNALNNERTAACGRGAHERTHGTEATACRALGNQRAPQRLCPTREAVAEATMLQRTDISKLDPTVPGLVFWPSIFGVVMIFGSLVIST